MAHGGTPYKSRVMWYKTRSPAAACPRLPPPAPASRTSRAVLAHFMYFAKAWLCAAEIRNITPERLILRGRERGRGRGGGGAERCRCQFSVFVGDPYPSRHTLRTPDTNDPADALFERGSCLRSGPLHLRVQQVGYYFTPHPRSLGSSLGRAARAALVRASPCTL